MAGFTLGVGYGWTSSKNGLACDHLLFAEIVLADGAVVRASERVQRELFWGIRGGGGNFGIVTEFEDGDLRGGRRCLQRLGDLEPAVELVATMPYTAIQAALDPLAPDAFLAHAVELTVLGAPFSRW